MRFSVAALIALVPLASAALIGRQADGPACATTCQAGAISLAGDCQITDTACLCRNEALIANVMQCIQTNCPPDDVQAATEAGVAFCAAAGVTLSAPAETVAETATETASAMDSMSMSASSVMGSAAASASSVASGAASSAASVGASASSAASSAASAAKSGASSAASSAAAAATNTGAATGLIIPGTGLLAAAMGLIVAL